jgi:hypothetical protein
MKAPNWSTLFSLQRADGGRADPTCRFARRRDDDVAKIAAEMRKTAPESRYLGNGGWCGKTTYNSNQQLAFPIGMCGASADENAELFHRTAARVYRLRLPDARDSKGQSAHPPPRERLVAGKRTRWTVSICRCFLRYANGALEVTRCGWSP